MSIWGYRIAALAISLTFGSLGAFVYLRNPRSGLYRDFFLFNLFVALWSLGFLLTMFAHLGRDRALFFSRLSHAFGAIVPIIFLKLALSLIGREKDKKSFLKINYFFTALLSAGFLAMPWFIVDVQAKLNFPYYPVAGPLYIVLIVYWLSLAGYAHYLLFLDYRQNQGHRRQQIKYFFLGQIIAWGGTSLLFPLIYGIKIDPVTYALLPIYPILTTYAIVRHQLLDIRLIIQKTFLYSLFIFVASLFYLAIVFIIYKIFLPESVSRPLLHFNATISIYSLPQLFGALIAAILGFFVLSRNWKSPLNRTFSAFGFLGSIWLGAASIAYSLGPDQKAIIFKLMRVSYSAVICMAIPYLSLTALITRSKSLTMWASISAFIAAFFVVTFWFTDWFIKDLYYFRFGFYPHVGWIHPFSSDGSLRQWYLSISYCFADPGTKNWSIGLETKPNTHGWLLSPLRLP